MTCKNKFSMSWWPSLIFWGNNPIWHMRYNRFRQFISIQQCITIDQFHFLICTRFSLKIVLLTYYCVLLYGRNTILSLHTLYTTNKVTKISNLHKIFQVYSIRVIATVQEECDTSEIHEQLDRQRVHHILIETHSERAMNHQVLSLKKRSRW